MAQSQAKSEIQAQLKFAKDLTTHIISKCAGTHDDDREVSATHFPSRNYFIGTLAARRHDERALPENGNAGNLSLEEEGGASVRAQRLKVSFLAKTDALSPLSEIQVEATGNVYYSVSLRTEYPSRSDATAQKKRREETESTNSELKNNSRWRKASYAYHWSAKPATSQSQKVDFSEVRQRVNNDAEITKIIPEDAWKAELSIEMHDFDKNNTLITISYTNTNIEPLGKKRKSLERTLFNCGLTVTLRAIKVSNFCDQYTYDGFKQRYFYDFRANNCQAYWREPGKVFCTSHYGYFEQEDIRPRESIAGVNLSFSHLASKEGSRDALARLIAKMQSFRRAYEKNLSQQNAEDDFQAREGSKQRTWSERRSLVENFTHMIEYVEEGLELLRSRNDVCDAFLKTNTVFDNYYKQKGMRDAGWRVFQIVFFLASIKPIAQREDLDIATVLHVDTGGGKSEAYFALMIFAAFLDRRSSKHEGVSSIVKFPLRMVSLDQLSRISNIIMHAEAVRQKYSTQFPGEPFSVGYYVGDSPDFPNSYKHVKERFLSKDSASDESSRSLILTECPFCSPVEAGTVHLRDDEKGHRMIHFCDKCGREFHIFISDREIFRWRPTVIVSTVDKWALLSVQRRARSLLGGNGSYCPDAHGFIPSGDLCEDMRDEAFQCGNIGKNLDGNSSPILSIQDEMHLLSEGFGTISSHFEGLIEAFVEQTSGHKLKHLAMSATLSGTSRQIKELYGKKAAIIPGRCPEGVGSKQDLFFTNLQHPKRIIIGLKPNLRDNHYASLRTLLHFGEFIVNAQKRLNSTPNAFLAEYGLGSVAKAQSLISQYLIPLSYHLKKQDAYDMQRLMDEVTTEPLRKTSNTVIRPTVLTGDSELDELKMAMDDVRSYIEFYDPDQLGEGDQDLMSLHATSVVSHGIDLEELNFMIFQGLPFSTAEYIQALSRTGRKQLGIVFLWFYPNRVRDDSYYRNFSRYHDTLEHQVKPTPINRFSRLGLYQTFNSIFCAAIINYLSNKKGRPLYRKKDILNLTPLEQKELVDIIQKAYGRAILEIDISKEANDRLNQIREGSDANKRFFPDILADSGEYFYRNQLGMRGIQQQLRLEINNLSRSKLRKGG